MTVANFQDYMQKITSDELIKYENPGFMGNVDLAKGYLIKDGGFYEIKVKFIHQAKQNASFFVPAGAIMALYTTIIGGIWTIPPILASTFIVGVKETIRETVISVQCSNEYRIWKAQHFEIDKKVLEVFKSFLKHDPVLGNMLCEISHELPEIPVKGPNGKTYNQTSVIELMKLNEKGRIAYGYEPINFTQDELVFDNDHFCQVIQRIKVLVESELDRYDLEKNQVRIIKDGLLVYKKNMDMTHYNFFQVLLKQSNEKLDRLFQAEINQNINVDIWEIDKKYRILRSNEQERLNNFFEPYKIVIQDKK